MANTKSAIKRIRRITRQTAVNKLRKRFRREKKMNLILVKNKKEAFLPKLNSELMKSQKLV